MKASEVVERLQQVYPGQPEYIQAVSQVLGTIEDEYNKHPEFDRENLIERLCIPDRIIKFRVNWIDDKGNVQTNNGYRVQHNNAIGPYKGGLRFHASVNESILKFLAFEQTSRPAASRRVRSCVSARPSCASFGIILGPTAMFPLATLA